MLAGLSGQGKRHLLVSEGCRATPSRRTHPCPALPYSASEAGNHLLSLEQMPGLPTDLSLHSRGRLKGAPDRCLVQRESRGCIDSQELSTKGPRVTEEKQGQMGPASPCQQCSLRSDQLGLSAFLPLCGKVHTGVLQPCSPADARPSSPVVLCLLQPTFPRVHSKL